MEIWISRWLLAISSFRTVTSTDLGNVSSWLPWCCFSDISPVTRAYTELCKYAYYYRYSPKHFELCCVAEHGESSTFPNKQGKKRSLLGYVVFMGALGHVWSIGYAADWLKLQQMSDLESRSTRLTKFYRKLIFFLLSLTDPRDCRQHWQSLINFLSLFPAPSCTALTCSHSFFSFYFFLFFIYFHDNSHCHCIEKNKTKKTQLNSHYKHLTKVLPRVFKDNPSVCEAVSLR